MLVSCPQCKSQVFARAAAIEQQQPQRCFGCGSQLLVSERGSASVAVPGTAIAASAGGAPKSAGGSVPAPVSGAFRPPAGRAVPAAVSGVFAGLPEAQAPALAGAAPKPGADKNPFEGPRPVTLGDDDEAADELSAPFEIERVSAHPAPLSHDALVVVPDLSLSVSLDLGFSPPDEALERELPWEPQGAPIPPPPPAPPHGTLRSREGEPEEDTAAAATANPDERGAGAVNPALVESTLEEPLPLGNPADAMAPGAVGERDAKEAAPSRAARPRGSVRGLLVAASVGLALGLAAAFGFPGTAPLSPSEQKLLDAKALIAEGQPAAALPLLEQVLAVAPDHPEALRHLAIASSLAGDTAAAERHYLRWLSVTEDEQERRAVRVVLGLDTTSP